MFYCCNCKDLFDEPSVYYEHFPYGEGYVSEKCSVSPCCGEGWEEAVVCPRCEEWVIPDDMDYVPDEYINEETPDEEICKVCLKELYGYEKEKRIVYPAALGVLRNGETR